MNEWVIKIKNTGRVQNTEWRLRVSPLLPEELARELLCKRCGWVRRVISRFHETIFFLMETYRMLPAQFFHVTSLKPKLIPTTLTIILFRKIYFNTKNRGKKLQSKGQFFKLDESSLMRNISSWGVYVYVCFLVSLQKIPARTGSNPWTSAC